MSNYHRSMLYLSRPCLNSMAVHVTINVIQCRAKVGKLATLACGVPGDISESLDNKKFTVLFLAEFEMLAHASIFYYTNRYYRNREKKLTTERRKLKRRTRFGFKIHPLTSSDQMTIYRDVC
ncbi:hypothetical protein CDAR_500251 [Caerostris darwini]|uniref:Uncharacterized protein n=1 Tax=Caerostris darwini TaxID=1538125 RepID=A0AAV4M9C2_9ARAC|nr:hypothetical protein CDAR_500251 [Caerostris darwini]